MGKRDTNTFRLRFNRWKNGEQVYSGGRPVEYQDGKDAGIITPPALPVKHGDKVDTDQCATWSNGWLRDNGYLTYGNAWNLKNVDTLYNGYTGIEKPPSYDKDSIERYNHAAADSLYKNFDSSILDKSKPYAVNMFYNGSPAQEEAYKKGSGVTGTHTGVLTFNPSANRWYVTHNIHGTIHQEPFVPLLSGKGKYGVTAIYKPRENTVVNKVKGLFGFLDGKESVDWKRWDDAHLTSYFIPFIEEKAVLLTNAGRATGAILSTNVLDTLADNAIRAGVPIKTAIGLGTKETTLGNPTDDRTAWKMSSGIRREFNGIYPGTYQHINYGGDGLDEREDLINYHKGIQADESEYKGKSVVQEALEFYKKYPNLYNTHLKNYSKLVDKRSEEVWQSPEIQQWWKQRTMQKVLNDMKNLGKHYVRPGFLDGKEPNAFDKWRENHPVASDVASFVPIVGTAMDVYDAYKDPTAANIGYAALSAVTDLLGGRLITKAVGQSIKRAKLVKKLTKEAKIEMQLWPCYKNMAKKEAKDHIEYMAKRQAESAAEKLGYEYGGFVDDVARIAVPTAIYFPDALANLNQINERKNTVE